jgi:ABC-type antimicrobial peptide transport system permease subunit
VPSTLDHLRNGERGNQNLAILIAGFAGLALGLASIGLYGVTSYLVARRTREIGIRMALGGRPADLQRLILGERLATVGAGLAVGLAGSLATTPVVSAPAVRSGGLPTSQPMAWSARCS